MFTVNEGALDRIVRVGLGLALLLVALLALSGVWQLVAGGAGLILLITGAVGFCPLYSILRVSTRPAPPAARR